MTFHCTFLTVLKHSQEGATEGHSLGLSCYNYLETSRHVALGKSLGLSEFSFSHSGNADTTPIPSIVRFK